MKHQGKQDKRNEEDKQNEEDNQCFKWCVTRALNPVDVQPERRTKILREQVESLHFDLNFQWY